MRGFLPRQSWRIGHSALSVSIPKLHSIVSDRDVDVRRNGGAHDSPLVLGQLVEYFPDLRALLVFLF
jgi:hypothetical protein